MTYLDVIWSPGYYLILTGIKYWYLVLAVLLVAAGTGWMLLKKKKHQDQKEEPK